MVLIIFVYFFSYFLVKLLFYFLFKSTIFVLHRSLSLQQCTMVAMAVGHSYPVLNSAVPASPHS